MQTLVDWNLGICADFDQRSFQRVSCQTDLFLLNWLRIAASVHEDRGKAKPSSETDYMENEVSCKVMRGRYRIAAVK